MTNLASDDREAVLNHVNLYDGEASHERAAELRLRTNQMLRSDLINFSHATRRVLHGMADAVGEAAEQLDPSIRLAPSLFTYHQQIHTGIKRRDPGRIGGAFGELVRTVNEGRHVAPEFTIDNLQWDTMDREVYAFLVSSEGPRTRSGGLPIVQRLTESEFVEAAAWVRESLPILQEVDPGIYDEFNYFISGLRLFKGEGARGITSSGCLGKIFLRVPDPGLEVEEPITYFLDHITHETSHCVLHAIMSTDPLILNGFTGRFSAPIRYDPRPLYGIYHATFVLSRIARVLNTWAARVDRPQVNEWRDLAITRFYKGYDTISEHGELTDAGVKVMSSCKKIVDAL